ncbi:MAG: hypothetical protein ACTS68_02040 [Candidatus Hodgkinia cicadicola]
MIGNGKVASFCGRQIWGERLGQLRYCAGALESWEASTGDERARRGRKRNAMWTKVEMILPNFTSVKWLRLTTKDCVDGLYNEVAKFRG